MNTNTDSKLQEQISHTTDSAPYSVHYTRVPADTDPALYLHWHNEMEFLYLVEGDLLFQIENQSFSLHAKEGIFIPVQLAPAFTYIQEHYQQTVTLEELASTVHLSRGQFCRTFKHLTGVTLFHYLLRYRILQSCNALSNTNKKITDIATSHGFNNISYFNRAFIQLMNKSVSLCIVLAWFLHFYIHASHNSQSA